MSYESLSISIRVEHNGYGIYLCYTWNVFNTCVRVCVWGIGLIAPFQAFVSHPVAHVMLMMIIMVLSVVLFCLINDRNVNLILWLSPASLYRSLNSTGYFICNYLTKMYDECVTWRVSLLGYRITQALTISIGLYEYTISKWYVR